MDKLQESFDDDDIDEIDEMSTKLLGRKLLTGKKKAALGTTERDRIKLPGQANIHGMDPTQLMEEFQSIGSSAATRAQIQEMIRISFMKKLATVGGRNSGTSVAVANLLNEIKDKDFMEGSLIEACIMALSRLNNGQSVFAAFEQYQEMLAIWQEDQIQIQIQIAALASQKEKDEKEEKDKEGGGEEVEEEGLSTGKVMVLENHSYPQFGVELATSCFTNGLPEAGRKIMKSILDAKNKGEGRASSPSATCMESTVVETDFLPGVVCGAIFDHIPVPSWDGADASTSKKGKTEHKEKSVKKGGKVVTHKNKNKDKDKDNNEGETDIEYVAPICPPEVKTQLKELHTQLPALKQADKVNCVIRALGRRRLITEIFELLDAMRACGSTPTKGTKGCGTLKDMSPNDESLEFLANAIVASVEEEARSRSMKDLPPPSEKTPEVLLVGRSNVGKSTLVNFLVNRKALASVSATPGHTTQFHFFAVNKNRADLPSFRLVDVPGLGYAEGADIENTLVSWRGLLERYLTVRDSLGMVLHLIDSRHKLTPTDKMLFEMGCRAAEARKKAFKAKLDEAGEGEGKGSMPMSMPMFQYAVILTKADRAGEKALRNSLKEIQEGIGALDVAIDVTDVTDVTGGVKGKKGNNGNGNSNGNSNSNIPVIVTSSIDKVGRDEVWKLLQDVIPSPVRIIPEE